MPITIKKCELKLRDWTTTAFIFCPGDEVKHYSTLSILTHGYTSHKGSILNWPTRLAEEGVFSILFDLPGHYLGASSEVQNFKEFCEHGHELFSEAFKLASNVLKQDFQQCVLCGHSLGALLAFKASELNEFNDVEVYSIGVGLGMAPESGTHIFNTAFYKSTLAIRAQMVSPALHPDKVFPWIKEEKEALDLHQKTFYLITGEDDLVVPSDGTERLASLLEEKGNEVIVQRPKKLPHHQPELGASHVKAVIKKNLIS